MLSNVFSTMLDSNNMIINRKNQLNQSPAFTHFFLLFFVENKIDKNEIPRKM
jgi:hypothetical protein